VVLPLLVVPPGVLVPDLGFGILDPAAPAPDFTGVAPEAPPGVFAVVDFFSGMVLFCVLCVLYVTVVVGRPPTVRCSVSMVVKTSGSLVSDMSLPATDGGRELRELLREDVRLAGLVRSRPMGLRSVVRGRVPPILSLLPRMFLTSVSGLIRDRGCCCQARSYLVFSRIFMIGPLAAEELE